MLSVLILTSKMYSKKNVNIINLCKYYMEKYLLFQDTFYHQDTFRNINQKKNFKLWLRIENTIPLMISDQSIESRMKK